MVALDTNTVIHYFKGLGRVAARLHATPPAEIAVPSVVVHELELGVLKSDNPERRRQQLYTLLAHVTVLALGDGEAKTAAKVRVELESKGLGIGPLDTLIAGTVLHHSATLVTRNTREFERVEGLKLENWYD
ncbi:type II toxin-antitoxin system VapC family toxin [soil metagenome]